MEQETLSDVVHDNVKYMVLLLWKAILQFLTKVNAVLPPNLAVRFLGLYPVDIKACDCIYYTEMFIYINTKLESMNLSFSR